VNRKARTVFSGFLDRVVAAGSSISIGAIVLGVNARTSPACYAEAASSAERDDT